MNYKVLQMSKQKNIFSFQTPEESPGFLLWQISNLWQRKMRRGLENLDLTHVQFVLLAALQWLSDQQSAVNQMDIADHTKVDKMMVSKVLRTLQKKDLLTRSEHEADTRAKTVSLTPAGRKLLKRAVKIVEGIDNEFFSKLGEHRDRFREQMLMLMLENNDRE